MAISVYFRIIIRLYAADIYSRCNLSRLNGNGSVCPHLNNFIRTSKWCFVFKVCVFLDHDLISNSVIVVDYCRVLANEVVFNLRLSTLKYISPIFIWFIGRIMSRPKNNWPGFFSLVRWYIDRTVKASVLRIPIQGSESSKYVSCRLYVHKMFPNTWCIISMVAFACEFPGESGLVLIPYYCSIKLFLNLWPRNYPPL